jgi:hypothetical protein
VPQKSHSRQRLCGFENLFGPRAYKIILCQHSPSEFSDSSNKRMVELKAKATRFMEPHILEKKSNATGISGAHSTRPATSLA